jgi:hypothetical protein
VELPINNVREFLIELIIQTIDALAVEQPVEWLAVVDRLEQAREAALQRVYSDAGLLVSVVSAANLLVDCARGHLDTAALATAVRKLDVGPGWDAGMADLCRHGPSVRLAEEEKAMGFSAMHWSKFVEFFAPELSYAANPRLHEVLFAQMHDRSYRLPVKDVLLADPSGTRSSWVTDDEDNGAKFRSDDPTRDVYDALGLDWSGLPRENVSVDGTLGFTRAVLFCCAMDVRQRAATTLCCPNAIDGWGNLLFVSRHPTGALWPRHGSATARPDDDAPSLPEAIHGPAAASNDTVSVLPIGYIRIGVRAAESGAGVSARAIARLRSALSL